MRRIGKIYSCLLLNYKWIGVKVSDWDFLKGEFGVITLKHYRRYACTLQINFARGKRGEGSVINNSTIRKCPNIDLHDGGRKNAGSFCCWFLWLIKSLGPNIVLLSSFYWFLMAFFSEEWSLAFWCFLTSGRCQTFCLRIFFVVVLFNNAWVMFEWL